VLTQKFNSSAGKFPLPIFFPDATQGVVKTLDSKDVEATKTPGILVNTYHLYRELGEDVIEKFDGIGNFMNWKGAAISDSGGFQVMSLIKSESGKGRVDDLGIRFHTSKKRQILLTPEKSIEYQLHLKTDLIVVLDDFTPLSETYEEARESTDRTVKWAIRCKNYFEKNCDKKRKPYIIGVVQGGKFLDLRRDCTQKLVEIGFDGLGYGGWPINEVGKFDYRIARIIAKYSPKDYLLYGLGIGKPDDIVNLVKMGYSIFDCVLPTRDARHRRLYVYNADSMDKIDVESKNFYKYFYPDRQIYSSDKEPVSLACDCLLCKNYSRAYLKHLFKIGEISAMRLATIHNLRFYSILMEKLQKKLNGRRK
jgi:queuine tRNA-ribosyltransferase